MGACASKPKVLEGTAPHVAGEDIIDNNKQQGIVGGDDVTIKPHSLSNLFKESEEGIKGPEQVKAQTTQAQAEEIENVVDAHITTKIEEVLSNTEIPQSQAFFEKTTEEITKSETKTPTEEVIKSEAKTPVHEIIKSEAQTPIQKVLESETETPIQEVVKSEIETPVQNIVKSEIETPVQDIVKSETETPMQEVVKSEIETLMQEVVKSETETPVQEVVKSETKILAEKKIEEVKEKMVTPVEEVTQEEKKIEENSKTKSEAPVLVEEKPAKKPVIEEKKLGKFWWDK